MDLQALGQLAQPVRGLLLVEGKLEVGMLAGLLRTEQEGKLHPSEVHHLT